MTFLGRIVNNDAAWQRNLANRYQKSSYVYTKLAFLQIYLDANFTIKSDKIVLVLRRPACLLMAS